MPCPTHDELDHAEYPDPADCTEDDAGIDEIPCPKCARMIYEQSQQCPQCGEWVLARSSGLAVGWLFIAVLALIAFVAVAVF